MLARRSLRAITLDAFGTLLELEDPLRPLGAALAARGVTRGPDEIARAFEAEVAHYLPRSWTGRDEESLLTLRRECAGVFLDELSADLDPDAFVEPFVRSLVFRAMPGTKSALEQLQGAGFRLACVSNWDYLLPSHISRAGLAGVFETVVSSAEAGASKPDPRIFQVALERLGVTPGQALHVGDQTADREGARAAGLRFEPPPVVTLPERLGL